MGKTIIHDVNPVAVPEIGSGLELNKLLKEFIQKKNGQQQISGWFLFCFDCVNEMEELPKFKSLSNNCNKESFVLLEKLEQSGIKLKI